VVKVAQGMRLCAEILGNFQFWGLTPPPLNQLGEIWRGAVTPPRQISPQSVQRVASVGREAPKSPMSNRNAAGKYDTKDWRHI